MHVTTSVFIEYISKSIGTVRFLIHLSIQFDSLSTSLPDVLNRLTLSVCILLDTWDYHTFCCTPSY